MKIKFILLLVLFMFLLNGAAAKEKIKYDEKFSKMSNLDKNDYAYFYNDVRPNVNTNLGESFGVFVFKDNLSADLNDQNTPEPTNEENTSENDSTSLKEANMIILKATKLASQGKRHKAKKLFEHVLSMKPDYVFALNSYGEFLEADDVVEADRLYQRALTHQPDDVIAKSNRKRVATLVQQANKKIFDEIDTQLADLYARLHSNPEALKEHMEESLYHHIHHTAALEGNKLSLEEVRRIIDYDVTLDGRSFREQNEVLGLADAMRYVNNYLVSKENITLRDIEDVHLRLLGKHDPVVAGKFRTSQVYLGNYVPPNPQRMNELLQHFEDWINSDSFLHLHPVERAALTHFRLTHVHPFEDGNKRTSRMMMNVVLMRSGFPPVIIRNEDRPEYHQALWEAFRGDFRTFVRFIAKCASRTLDEHLQVAMTHKEL